jgi:DNA invertase Pin-like site-specific DNA recombinase
MAHVGYARVSSVGQSFAVQLAKLQAGGCDPIFQEKASGTRDDRPALHECLRYVRTGDVLCITRLDRLARSTLHLCQLAVALDTKGVALRVLDQNIDISDATGRLLFTMLSAIAQFETELRAERQMEGIQKALARGVRFGRKHALTPAEVTTLRQQRATGVRIKDLMQQYGLSKASVYRYLDGTQPAEMQELGAGAIHCHGISKTVI